MCHHRTTEYKRLYEDRAHEDLPEWEMENETDEDTDAEDTDKSNPFAPVEAD